MPDPTTHGGHPLPAKPQDQTRPAPVSAEVEAALRDPELMRQLESSIQEMERGEKPVPLRDILAAQRERRTT